MVLALSDKNNKVVKEAQVEISGQRLQEMERLACLGEFVGGVAHEINNPLQIILGKAQILRIRTSQSQNSSKSTEDLAAIEKGAQRIAELINCLNDLAYQETQEKNLKTDVDLNYLFSSILPLIKACLKDKKIELSLNLTEKLPKVKGNSLELKKLFMFLMLNAKQRLSRGGKLGVNIQKEGRFLKVVFNDQSERSLKEEPIASGFTGPWLTEGKQDFGILSGTQILQEHKGELETIRNSEKGSILVVRLPLI